MSGTAARGQPVSGTADNGPAVHGPVIDAQTRCVHYHSPRDVVALKFRCCGRYYPCFQCHAETETHAPQRWPAEESEALAVLCGVCRSEISVSSYLGITHCPGCAAEFNPGCRSHAHLYFDLPARVGDAAAKPDTTA